MKLELKAYACTEDPACVLTLLIDDTIKRLRCCTNGHILLHNLAWKQISQSKMYKMLAVMLFANQSRISLEKAVDELSKYDCNAVKLE